MGIRPDDVEARNLLGYLLGKQGRRDAAAVVLQRTLQIDSTHADTWAHLGALQLAAKDFASARPYLEMAVQFNAHHTKAHFDLANCLMRLGQKESGRKMMRRFEMLRSIDADIVKFREAIRHDPADPALYRGLARLYASGGEPDKAIQLYRQLSHEMPNLPLPTTTWETSCYGRIDPKRRRGPIEPLCTPTPPTPLPTMGSAPSTYSPGIGPVPWRPLSVPSN